ncbi:MAG: HAD-IA family hydrolase [Verrucomicrobia bacterium]|nr:HAD-IA family hydrolase [Verrucomicrobiota bacterium]
MSPREKTLRAVVFDFDGTLVDSLPLVLRAITHAIEPFGPRPTMDIFAKLGGPPERFLRDLLDDARHVPVAVARMGDYHLRNQHLIRPFDGVEVVLQRLRSAGIVLALWTGRDRLSTEVLLREHRLTEHFAAVVCGDDLPTHKPDPEGLREILSRLGLAPAEVMMVGDADVDVLGAAGCGVPALLIRHGRLVDGEVREKAWRTVTSPHEAYELLLQHAE